MHAWCSFYMTTGFLYYLTVYCFTSFLCKINILAHNEIKLNNMHLKGTSTPGIIYDRIHQRCQIIPF